MGGGGGCRCVGIDVSLSRVMAAWRSLRRLFTLIPVGLVLPDCLLYYALSLAYCVLSFAKITLLKLHTQGK